MNTTYLVDKNSIIDICDAIRGKLQINNTITFNNIIPMIKEIVPEGSQSDVQEGMISISSICWVPPNNIANIVEEYGTYQINAEGFHYNGSNKASQIGRIEVVNYNTGNNLPSNYLNNNVSIGSPIGSPVYRYVDLNQSSGQLDCYLACDYPVCFIQTDYTNLRYRETYYSGELNVSEFVNLGNTYAKYSVSLNNFVYSSDKFKFPDYSCGEYTVDMSHAYGYHSRNVAGFNAPFVCGNNVKYLDYCYQQSVSKHVPVVGPNVINCAGAYMSCENAYGHMDLSMAKNCENFWGAFMSCSNILSVKMPVFEINKTHCGSMFSGCKNLSGNISFRSTKPNFTLNLGGCLYYSANRYVSDIVLYCDNCEGSLGLDVSLFRMNVFCNNYTFYNTTLIDALGIKAEDCSEDNLEPDILSKVVDDLEIKPIRYKYATKYNIYLYCIE